LEIIKKLSGWHRFFIVFAVVWIGTTSYKLYEYNANVPYPTIEDTEGIFELLKELENLGRNADGKGKYRNAQELHKATIRNYYEERRSLIFVFLRAWLWALWDKNCQMWHDKIAGTVVVDKR
jgi:glutathionylspermidine synthase